MKKEEIITAITYYRCFLSNDKISKSLERERWVENEIQSLYYLLGSQTYING